MKSHAEQQKEAEERSAVPAQTVHQAILIQGRDELSRPSAALAWSGLAGGLSMSASFLAEASLRAYLPEAEWTHLISKMGYPVGFLLVVLGRQQLFTENTLNAVLPLLHEPSRNTFQQVARLWTIVLLANIAGAHIAAWFYSNTSAVGPDIQSAMKEIAGEVIGYSFTTALVKGIISGWLIAMVVWLTAAMDTGKVAAVAIPTYLVGVGSFTHVIVGSIEVLFLVMSGSYGWLAYGFGFLIPTLIGNSLGGVLLVAALNHAQVVSGKDP
jgi:formate/nitrite transporter FocA (FNT family)